MRISFNEEQIRGFADFLLDIGKGLILGFIGAIVANTKVDGITLFAGILSAIIIVINGLYFLGKIK